MLDLFLVTLYPLAVAGGIFGALLALDLLWGVVGTIFTFVRR